MENEEVMEYIKNMFGSSMPEWAPELEGILFYDIDAGKWVVADNVGWVEL